MAEKAKEKVKSGTEQGNEANEDFSKRENGGSEVCLDDRVDYCLPMNLLTDDETMEACVNGKVYQIRCGETVRIPKGLAEVLDNAVSQKRKVDAMMKEHTSRSKEIS